MMTIHSRIVFAAILVAGMGATAQDVASEAGKAAKETGHATVKTAEATEQARQKQSTRPPMRLVTPSKRLHMA